ncbi:unnamed protein product, partial [Didymodactylos carnosus]
NITYDIDQSNSNDAVVDPPFPRLLNVANIYSSATLDSTFNLIPEWFAIGFASDGNNTDEMIGVIKNYLHLRQFALHWHIVTTSDAQSRLQSVISSWNISPVHFRLTFYDYSLCRPYTEPYEDWIVAARYMGSICKLALPHILPHDIRYVMSLDTDTVLLDGSLRYYVDCFYQYIQQFQLAEYDERQSIDKRVLDSTPEIPIAVNKKSKTIFDVDEIRKTRFNYTMLPPRPVLALAPDHHHEQPIIAIWPHMVQGTLNGGVMLFDCLGYRRHRIWEQTLQYNYIEWDKRHRSKAKWPQSADQNLLNLLISDNLQSTPVPLRSYSLVLPCSCNYLFPPWIDNNYRKVVCPIETRIKSRSTRPFRMLNEIIYDRLKQKLSSKWDTTALSISVVEARSATAYLKQVGWQQADSVQHENVKSVIKLGPLIYLAHSVGFAKTNDDQLNNLRRFYLTFEDKLLTQVNSWNYRSEQWK